jgi:sec-independent protein translocase protein TatC
LSIYKNLLKKRNTNPQAEMGFLDHVEDLRWHIIRSAAAILVAAIVVFCKVEVVFDRVILGPAHSDFVSYKWFCALGRLLHYDAFCLGQVTMKFQNTAVTGQFMMALSTSLWIGFIIAFPYVLWELWKFIKPALRPKEVKMAKGIVFWCSLLFFTGVFFAYYIVAPYAINFFGNYQLSPSVQNIVTLDNYFDMISTLVLALGIVFEMPILVLFLTRIGILTPVLLRKNRKLAFLILFILSEIITPPDLFSCLLVFIPLYILYEITVVMSTRTYRDRLKRQAEKENE